MKRLVASLVAFIVASTLVISGCTQSTPAASPTKAPAPTTAPAAPAAPKAAEATKAPAAAPTQAPQPTAVPAKKVDYPEKGKAITVIVPWPAGGGSDVGARLLATELEKELGVPLQVVNRAGGASQLGTSQLARSKPDGYTIGTTNLPSVPPTYLDPARGADYGRKDLQQVANQGWDPAVIAVRADSPYKNLNDVVDAAKANPEKIKVGDNGIGGAEDIGLRTFQKVAGVKFAITRLEGGPQSVAALLGGHIDVNANMASNVAPHYKSGQVRILGIMDKERSKFYPDVPTLVEQGFNVNSSVSRGISVAAGTPKEIVDVLEAAVKRAMEGPTLKQKMDEAFLTQKFMNAAQYTAYWDEVEAQIKPLMDDLAVK